MLGSDILLKFNVQVDDASELSDTEALDLANDIYQEIQDDRPWEWLRATASLTQSTSVPYIALPSDFKMMMPNYSGVTSGQFNNLGVPRGYKPPVYNNLTSVPVVIVGSTNSPYIVIPYAEHQNYINTDGYCYVDVPNSRLVFTKQPTIANSATFDYIKVAPALTTATSPLFRSGFHKIIPFGMAARLPQLTQADKGTSYTNENRALYMSTLEDMAVEDANLKLAYA